MALMTFESILAALPDDNDKAIESLIKTYISIGQWIAYHSSEKGQPEHLPHLKVTLTRVARELGRRLLAAYPAQGGEGESMDDVTALERIAGG